LAILDLPFPDDADELPAKDGSDPSNVTVADRDGPSFRLGLDPLGSPKVDDPDGRTSRELLGGDMEAAPGARPRPAKKPVGANEQLEGPAGLWANKSGQVGGESLPEQSKRNTRWRYDQDRTTAIRPGRFESSTKESKGGTEFDVHPQSSRTGVSPEIGDRVKDSLNGLSKLSGLHKKNYEDTHDYSTKFAEEERKSPRQSGRQSSAGQDNWSEYVPPRSGGESASRKMPLEKRSRIPDGLNEKTADNENFSTFSLHVSDVSFKIARAALANGVWPEAEKIRIEEFVNALDYGDPLPSQNEKVACCLEQSIHPFLQQRNLLRISMRTAAAGRASNTPLRLTFLLDNSGSMDRIDRQKTVRRCFALLAEQLTPIDQVTLISFARLPRLLADKVSGSESRMLVQLLDNLPSEGGTNIEAALKLAFEKAQEQRLDNAQNRIILLTDGAVNLGNANPDSLSRMIAKMRNAGIAFDAAGISAIGLNDEILEALTRQGDGRYYLLDSPDDADSGFVRQIAGALRPSAKNVKVQVEFNPKRVGRYKLLGFENRRLKKEDFRNDTVDAAEMAAAEAGVAMYQFEAKPDGEGDVGSVSVRFRDLSTGLMIEERWPIPYQPGAPRADQAAPSLRIASSAALFAAKLRGEPLGESVDLKTLFNLISGLPEPYRNADRVQQLQLMIQQARQVSGE
jgi:Mg-chelatase subunit ChlD